MLKTVETRFIEESKTNEKALVFTGGEADSKIL